MGGCYHAFISVRLPCKTTYQNVMSTKIRNGLGGNCQWLVSMFETNVIEASDILCRNLGIGNCQWLVSMFETNVIEASDILCRNFRSAL